MVFHIASLKAEDKPMVIASAFILVILSIGTVYTLSTQGSAPLLSPGYLLQQLQTGSFLGIVAAGMMVVILLGHIDLSVAWTMTAAAMMATTVGGEMAIPTGIAVGAAVGLVNGFGVAYLRVPSMIFAIFVWLAVSVVIAVMLKRTAFGREIYVTGNREVAAYLSGIRTRRVILGSFVVSGICAALAGVMLAGYSARAYQGMGNPFLLPAIAAVVIGGTRILGGQGRYIGTLIGVILIVLLNSVLSIMQMPEAGRQVIYGSVIISMLLVYGRGNKVHS